jgi:DNA-binding YbaB/EbfC family protein
VLPKGLGALGNLGNLGGLMKQAMEMRSKIEAMKDSLANEVIEASSGGGMVKVVINGRFEMISLKIEPEIIDRNDPEVLETLIRAAFNEAVQRAQEMIKSKMAELTNGVDIPGLTS